jgi:hypothetical protein
MGGQQVTYLTKFTHIRDEWAVVGEAVDETELVRSQDSLKWLHQATRSICPWSGGSGETP